MAGRIVITGGTGFIGRALSGLLLGKGYEVVVLSRSPEKVSMLFEGRVKGAGWNSRSSGGWASYADGAYGIVNLAGDSIGSGRWSGRKRRRIMESRVNAGRLVMEAVEKAAARPAVIVQGSAVGYYADLGDEFIDEDSLPANGFLADVAARWEESTRQARGYGVRVVAIRSAMVLGRGSVLLERLTLPLRFFAGGPAGSGRQWVPWIHVADEIRAIAFLLEQPDAEGVFNLASPNPVSNADLMKALGKAIGRPSWLRTPAVLLRIALGGMADELVLNSMRVVPKRLLDMGFSFSYPDIESALAEIFG